jgi:hypothetical protein
MFLKKNEIIPLLIGLFVGLYFFTIQIIDINFLYFPGDLGDGRLNLYFLEHAYQFFFGHVNHFWDAPFMYPEPNTIAYSDNLLGSAPIYFLFRIFGYNIYLSYLSWYVVVTSLNYIFAYILLRKLFQDNYAPVLGAFVFAFSIALQSQLTHAQTFPRFAIPLAFLMLIQFKDTLRPKYFFLTLFSVVYQIYCGIYLGFMLAIPILVFIILIFFQNKKVIKQLFNTNKKWVKLMISSIIVNFLLLTPLYHYLERNRVPTFNYFKQIVQTVPTIKSFFYSKSGSLLWDFLSDIGNKYPAWWDHQIFAGGIATISLLFVFFILIKKIITNKFSIKKISSVFLLMLSGLITFLLFIRFYKITLYLLIFFFPGYSSMRSLTRIINIELIFYAIATAFVFANMLKRKRKYSFFLFVFLLSILVVDNYYYKEGKLYRTRIQTAIERTNKFDNILSKIPDKSVISFEPKEKSDLSIYYNIDAMLFSQKYNFRSINGYTGSCPGDYAEFWRNIDAQSRNNWLKNKDLQFDTLYVITSKDNYTKIPVSEIRNNNPTNKLQNMIEFIKTDDKWMQLIRKKAQKKGISVDSMLILDATWCLKNKK